MSPARSDGSKPIFRPLRGSPSRGTSSRLGVSPRTLVFALALLSIACSACRPCKGVSSRCIADVLSGYQLLSNPRTAIPIGAVWYQATGPNGNGAASENIVTDDGAAVFKFTQVQRRVLAANVASFIGLTGVQAKQVVVDLEDLKVVRVKDIFQLDVTADDSILYEGISAGRMTFRYRRGLGLDLGSKFAAKNIPVVDAKLTTGNIESVTVDGSNLYLAYRVVKFVQLNRSESKVRTDGTPDDMSISVAGLKITADASAMKPCGHAADVQDCIAAAPIKMTIMDPNLTTISGKAFTKDITVRIGQDREKPFTILQRKEKDLATGTVLVARYIQFDIPTPRVSPSTEPSVLGGHDSPVQMAYIQFIPGAVSGKLTEIFYEMRDLADPQAKGW